MQFDFDRHINLAIPGADGDVMREPVEEIQRIAHVEWR
jgi:hypothetical protein